jgi:pyroglutamyl-peptidase
MMGVAASSSTFRLECRAVNRVGRDADVRGVVRAEPVIDGLAPGELPTTLWVPAVLGRLRVGEGSLVTSCAAGEYLCNYLYFRALRRVVDRPVGFLHVPPVEAMGLGEQAEVVERVLGVVESLM